MRIDLQVIESIKTWGIVLRLLNIYVNSFYNRLNFQNNRLVSQFSYINTDLEGISGQIFILNDKIRFLLISKCLSLVLKGTVKIVQSCRETWRPHIKTSYYRLLYLPFRLIFDKRVLFSSRDL